MAKYRELIHEAMYNWANKYSDEVLTHIFNDYIRRQNISEDSVKAVYVQNFLNNKEPAIYAVIDNNIVSFSYTSKPTGEITKEYTTKIEIVNKDRIEKIEFTGVGETVRRSIDPYAVNSVVISFANGKKIELSNVDDANENWKSAYTDMMLYFISQL